MKRDILYTQDNKILVKARGNGKILLLPHKRDATSIHIIFNKTRNDMKSVVHEGTSDRRAQQGSNKNSKYNR